jgi:hypothetical protein
MSRVAVFVKPARVENFETGRDDHRSDLEAEYLLFLVVVDRIRRANFCAHAASFALPQLAAAFRINAVRRGNRLRVILVYGFALAYSSIVIIYRRARAFVRASPAGDTLIQADIARMPAHFYLKSPFLPFNAVNLRIGEQIDV